jgi:hypothetical protein
MSRRRLYQHLNRSQLLIRHDKISEFMNLNHRGKTTILQLLFREGDFDEYNYLKSHWDRFKANK